MSTKLYAFIHSLHRDADQPDAEQLAFDLENDYEGTGMETIQHTFYISPGGPGKKKWPNIESGQI